MTESLRARSLASRQDNIVSEFISSADKIGQKVTLQSEKFITLKNSKNEEIVVIPTVGVPQAFTYNQSEELVSRIKTKEIKMPIYSMTIEILEKNGLIIYLG